MNEQCKECVYAISLSKEVADIKIRIDKAENKLDKIEDTVNIMDKDLGINQEQTKMVFKILEEIKASIEKIANKMDVVEKRPSTTEVNNNVKDAKESVDGNSQILSSLVDGNKKLLYGVIIVLAIITLFSIGMKASDIAKLIGRG